MNHQSVNDGFDRFQRFLLAMHIGDEVNATDAASLTGLAPEMCRAVLEGLTRAGLMTHQTGDRFVRCSLDCLGV